MKALSKQIIKVKIYQSLSKFLWETCWWKTQNCHECGIGEISSFRCFGSTKETLDDFKRFAKRNNIKYKVVE